MGVTLRLAGGLTTDDDAVFDRIERWLAARPHDPTPIVQRSEESPLLVAELHPAAEPIELALREGTLSLSAKTSTAGPGYHRLVCRLASALAEELGFVWDMAEDETGWWKSHDDAELESCFLDWLGGAVAQVREMAADGMRGFALSLPQGHAFDHDGLLATPLGPRDDGWVAQVLADPRHGIDAFPCWSDAGSGAYVLGIALTRMWCDVRWRAPLDDAETALLEGVATHIEKAFGLDPELSVPWVEQSEILTLLSEESLRATRAHVKAQSAAHAPSIGYRRRSVRVTLSGGWHITIPGELAERWEERGTWVGWDETRSVWFTSLTVHDDAGTPSPDSQSTLASLPPIEGDEVLELERGALRGRAVFHQEEADGQTQHRLEAHAAEAHHAAVGTVVFMDGADREWALSTWGSLTR
ncbi:MAG: hypothetical protein AB8I08_37780 [Sandaracinaceae bacterium]